MESKVSCSSSSSNNNTQSSGGGGSTSKKRKKKRSQAVAFGRTYFHAIGGTTPARVVPATATTTETTTTASATTPGDDDPKVGGAAAAATEKVNLQQQQQLHHQQLEEENQNHPLICYQWKYPPWMKPLSRKKKSTSKESDDNVDDDDDEDSVQIDEDDPNAVIRQAEASSQSTLFLTEAGKVYQTGTLHGHQYTSPTLITIPMPLKCVEIAAGRHFCLARMQDGMAVVSWGAGHFGQLGVQCCPPPEHVNNNNNDSSNSDDDDDDDDDSPESKQITFTSRPVIIEGLLPRAVGSPIQQIAAGDWHGMALTKSGRVFCWGSNRSQQCGRKPPKSGGGGNPAPTILTPAPVPMNDSSSSTSKSSSSSPSDWLRVSRIAAGRSHSVALVQGTGQVYCWGSTLYGQCGNFVRRTPVCPPRRVDGLQDLSMVQIAAAGCHSLALTTGGRVFGWGQCHEGQLGVAMPNLNSSNHGNVSITTTTTTTVMAAAPRPRLVADLDFVAIAAGQEWKTQQKLQQQQQQRMEAAAAAEKDSLDNSVRMGDNVDSSSLSSLAAAAPDTTTTTATTTCPLSTIPRITQIYAGAFYSVAVSSSGHVYTFGSNDAGQLGVPRPRHLPFRETGHHQHQLTAAAAVANVVAAVTPSTVRELNVQSFDSRHNVLLPVRVEAAMPLHVRTVACGPNHLWCIGEERQVDSDDYDEKGGCSNVIGRTLYEVQEGHRHKTLQRARAHRQQQQHQHSHQEQQRQPQENGVKLLPTQPKVHPKQNDDEAVVGSDAHQGGEPPPTAVVRPSPLVDFLSTDTNVMASPTATNTTAAADGLLTPSTVDGAEEGSACPLSPPIDAAGLTTTMTLSAPAVGATSSPSPLAAPTGSPKQASGKRTKSRGLIRRLSSGIRKRLGGSKNSSNHTIAAMATARGAQEQDGQQPLETESERGNRRRNNHDNAANATDGSPGGDTAPSRMWRRKRNTIG